MDSTPHSWRVRTLISIYWDANGYSAYSDIPQNFMEFTQFMQCRSVLSQTINIQNPSSYSFLKSISILSSHIHTGLLNGLFPSHFPIKNLFKITFTPIHATFLTHFATVLWYPSIWQAVQIMKLHILHPFPPISFVICSKTILITVLKQNQFINGKKHSPQS